MRPFSICITVALIALAVIHAAAARGPTVKDFEYFILARQWPGTYCGPNAPQCARQPQRDIFTIHGLWPDNTRGPDPARCDKSDAFDVDLIEDLRPQLLVFWPSYSKSNEWFWGHEWTKHGTCSKSILPDEAAYFSKVLELNEQYNLTEALNAQGIQVGSDVRVPTRQVAAAFEEAFGGIPEISCGPDGVKEIFTCFDKEFQPMDCPDAAAQTNAPSCGSTVKFPSIFDEGNQRI